jgi:hypothetical protein
VGYGSWQGQVVVVVVVVVVIVVIAAAAFTHTHTHTHRVLVGKPEGKRPLGRPRRRWEDNIKMDLQEWDVGVWTESCWLRIGTGGRHL